MKRNKFKKYFLHEENNKNYNQKYDIDIFLIKFLAIFIFSN
jgi:hypothetical protein